MKSLNHINWSQCKHFVPSDVNAVNIRGSVEGHLSAPQQLSGALWSTKSILQEICESHMQNQLIHQAAGVRQTPELPCKAVLTFMCLSCHDGTPSLYDAAITQSSLKGRA